MTVNDGDVAPAQSPSRINKAEVFDQPVILQQPSVWSRAILWGILGVTTFVVGWAAIARIEEAVPAQGKLQPQGSVQNIQAPVGGVVSQILVQEGEQVEAGQVLIRFDPRATQAQIESLEKIRASLLAENEFYRSQLAGSSDLLPPENLSPEVQALTQNRASLQAEIRLFQAQINGDSGAGLSPEDRIRLAASQQEANSREAAARLEAAQLREQLQQTEGQLATARRTLEIDQGILRDVEPLVREGGLARVQYMRQVQETMRGRAEVERLQQEIQRLKLAIAQAEERYANALATTRTDLLTRISQNRQRIAEIDSQLNKVIVENEKRIAEINSQLEQAKLNLQYQELRAPSDGMVFDLQAKGPGFVATTSEPILKIVPTDALVAEVYITNQDIGFVREGMPVDVRIDSFPFSEFGDIKGTVVTIGDDALPPDQIHPYARFPAKIKLDSQTLLVENTPIPLQSGMSVSANIITRDRTVLSIFTDLFSRRIESLKNVR